MTTQTAEYPTGIHTHADALQYWQAFQESMTYFQREVAELLKPRADLPLCHASENLQLMNDIVANWMWFMANTGPSNEMVATVETVGGPMVVTYVPDGHSRVRHTAYKAGDAPESTVMTWAEAIVVTARMMAHNQRMGHKVTILAPQYCRLLYMNA